MSADVVVNFMAICECSEAEAIQYLSQANFDLGIAHTLYMTDNEQMNPREPPVQPPEAIGPQSPAETSTAGSPGYVSPPYHVTVLDGSGGGVGAPQERSFFSTASVERRPEPRQPQQQRQQQQRQRHSSRDEPLPLLFSTPSFVHTGARSFDHFCRQSLEKEQWVLLCIVADSFKSFCVNRDVWKPEGGRELLNMFSIYQVNCSSDRGMQLLHGYNVEAEDLPVLFIINPLTTRKEVQVDLRFDSNNEVIQTEEVRDTLLLFLGERGSPAQWIEREKKKQEQKYATQTPSPTPEPDIKPSVPELLQSQTMSSTRNREVVAEGGDAAVDVDPVERTVDTRLPPTTTPEPVVISAYELPAEVPSAFSLRCRLPKEQVTLRLKPETPAQLLLDYLAYRVYLCEPDAYPSGAPLCELKSGFPPKEVEIKPNAQLCSLGTVRSGDNVFVHIK